MYNWYQYGAANLDFQLVWILTDRSANIQTYETIALLVFSSPLLQVVHQPDHPVPDLKRCFHDHYPQISKVCVFQRKKDQIVFIHLGLVLLDCKHAQGRDCTKRKKEMIKMLMMMTVEKIKDILMLVIVSIIVMKKSKNSKPENAILIWLKGWICSS